MTNEDIARAAMSRRQSVYDAARDAGLLDGGNDRLGARVPRRLIDTAKNRSGIDSTTDLIEYALAKVALEDDFGAKLLARKGRIPPDLAL